MYIYLKAFHIISVVAWFAGLFYIFRLFVYHVKYKNNQSMCEAYSTMERKLLNFIIHPAMTLAFIFGILMIYYNRPLLYVRWLHLKFLGVVLLLAYQTLARITYKKFLKGNFFLTEKACRLINEVPTVLLIFIVILAVVKPRI